MNQTLYLICTADHLETALFCGTSAECMALLGIRSASYFCRAIKKRQKVMGFFRVEKVQGRIE